MFRYAVLLRYTERGAASIHGSPARAAEFAADAARHGVTVESQLWLQGEYDGLLVLTAGDEAAVPKLALHLAAQGFVRTTLLRAYNEAEFRPLTVRV